MASVVTDYLSADEDIKLQWKGGLKTIDDGLKSWQDKLETGTNKTTFAATTQRLLYINEDSSFKDIEYSHISSVEVDKSTKPMIEELTLMEQLAMVGILIGVVGVVGIFSSAFVIGILGLGGSGVILGVILMKVEDHSEFLIPSEKTTYEVRIITGDEAHQQIEFETEENVGAGLSRIIRQHS
jgi:hypothetical protein